MRKIEVSVITPAYNASRYIRECVESVLSQTINNWEMIIVNDASIDDTQSIIQEYLVKDDRIRCIQLDNNGGIANARNTGVKSANGKYIAFLDSDDRWHSDKLEKQLDFAKKNQASFVFSSYDIIDDDSRFLNQTITVPQTISFEDLLRANYIGCLTVMIDSEKVKDISFPKIKHEDYACWLSILSRGIIAYGQKEVLADYRKSITSVSGNKIKAIGWVWNIFRNHLHFSFIKAWLYTIRYAFNTLIKYASSRGSQK